MMQAVVIGEVEAAKRRSVPATHCVGSWQLTTTCTPPVRVRAGSEAVLELVPVPRHPPSAPLSLSWSTGLEHTPRRLAISCCAELELGTADIGAATCEISGEQWPFCGHC
jgi:hypothetical protein